MKSKILIEPIGIVHSPFKDASDNVPIQGRLYPESSGNVAIFPDYKEGLIDIDGFSHIFLIYYFHGSSAVKLKAKPYLENVERGIFSIRSPHRPNHIGLTLVELLKVEDATLEVKGLDMIDGTPLLDIKPYNPFFDAAENAKIGWMAKHFMGEKKPAISVNSKEQWLHK